MNNTLSYYIRSHDKRTLSLCEKRLNTKFSGPYLDTFHALYMIHIKKTATTFLLILFYLIEIFRFSWFSKLTFESETFKLSKYSKNWFEKYPKEGNLPTQPHTLPQHKIHKRTLYVKIAQIL